jgi:hypothetical protein
LLIDVNPRFYNHMAFEIARGLALPWLAYLGALGDDTALRAAMDAPHPGSHGGPAVYVHRLPAALMLSLQGAGGKMSRADRRKWRLWMAEHAGRIIDPARAPGDPRPSFMDLVYQAMRFLRHPRAFLRDLWCDGEPPAR